MEPKKIGYARVSTVDQHLDRQIKSLNDAGCERIFQEKLSGKTTEGRVELRAAIDALDAGDTLVIAEWDRATRSMYDGIAIMKEVHAKGAYIKILDKPHLDLATPIGQGFLAFLSALAEDERQRIHKRAQDGIASAKARGVRFGRKSALSSAQLEHAAGMQAEGKTLREIGALLGVSHTTVGRGLHELAI